MTMSGFKNLKCGHMVIKKLQVSKETNLSLPMVYCLIGVDLWSMRFDKKSRSHISHSWSTPHLLCEIIILGNTWTIVLFWNASYLQGLNIYTFGFFIYLLDVAEQISKVYCVTEGSSSSFLGPPTDGHLRVDCWTYNDVLLLNTKSNIIVTHIFKCPYLVFHIPISP